MSNSMGNGYIVFDIETVPDHSIWTPPGPEPPRLSEEKKPGKADLEFLARAAERDLTKLHPADIEKAHDIATRAEKTDLVAKFAPALAPEKRVFPPLYAQQPIVIGFLCLSADLEIGPLGCASASTFATERELLAGWAAFVGRERPTIVTWNGRGFDVPVINLRSFRHGVDQGWCNKDYRYRYNEDRHLDLCDVMTDFGFVQKAGFKLGTVAKLIGCPGKDDLDGSMVEAVYKEPGGIAKIETYCQTDVIQTAFVFMRFLLLRGRLRLESYQSAVRRLLTHCRTMPQLTEFMAGFDDNQLLLEAPALPVAAVAAALAPAIAPALVCGAAHSDASFPFITCDKPPHNELATHSGLGPSGERYTWA